MNLSRQEVTRSHTYDPTNSTESGMTVILYSDGHIVCEYGTRWQGGRDGVRWTSGRDVFSGLIRSQIWDPDEVDYFLRAVGEEVELALEYAQRYGDTHELMDADGMIWRRTHRGRVVQ